MQFLLGLLLSALIGFVAYRRGSLSKSGVVGAILIGTLIFGLGGWVWGVLLVVFFVSSSALSHYKRTLKASLAEKFSKGHQRDLAQTLANGGAGALIVVTYSLVPHLVPRPMLWVAFVGAMAAVNADTWATELGVLSKTKPRHILTGKEVETGTSGGITSVGTVAAFAGSALIAVLGGFNALHSVAYEMLRYLNEPYTVNYMYVSNLYRFDTLTFLVALAAGTAGGISGSLFDSMLGATAQAMYYCDHCRKETERHPIHTCSNPTHQLRGWRWLDNDWVNFLSSVVGAGVAGGVWLLAR